jgi:hypothetical protein
MAEGQPYYEANRLSLGQRTEFWTRGIVRRRELPLPTSPNALRVYPTVPKTSAASVKASRPDVPVCGAAFLPA